MADIASILLATLTPSSDAKRQLAGPRLKEATKSILAIARLAIQIESEADYDRHWRMPTQAMLDSSKASDNIKSLLQQIISLRRKVEKRRRGSDVVDGDAANVRTLKRKKSSV